MNAAAAHVHIRAKRARPKGMRYGMPCGYTYTRKARPPEGHGMRIVRMNYAYIVKCSDSTYYTGWTNNLDKRIQAHNEGKGAKYTKGRRPVTLVYYEVFEQKEAAMRREWEIKRLTRKQKEQLFL